MRQVQQKELEIHIEGVDVKIEYEYTPKSYFDYNEPPEPAEVYLIAAYIDGSYQNILPLLDKHGDYIIDEIFNHEI